MRKYFLLLAALVLLAIPTHATYVSSGAANFSLTSSTTCVPNTGTLNVGDSEVIGVQSGSATEPIFSISSSHVTSWILDQSNLQGSSYMFMWHGKITSAGTGDSIVVTYTLASGLIGSVCGEYTTNSLNVTNSAPVPTGGSTVSVTTTQATTDLIVMGTSGGGGTSVSSPFTVRQSATYVATVYLVLADENVGSTGTYTATITGSGPGALMDALYFSSSTNSGCDMSNVCN